MIHIQLSDSQLLEILTHWKFLRYPHIKLLQVLPPSSSVSTSGDMSRENQQKYIKDIESYKSELRAMPPEDLRALYRQEQEKARHECRVEFDEPQRFFNCPQAEADFTHWSKATYWTLDEAIALAFGKDPAVVKWENVESYVDISPFAKRYAQVRDLALRVEELEAAIRSNAT